MARDNAGNTIQDANTSAFKTLKSKPIRFSDFVGNSDTDDFYRLNFKSSTSLDLTLDQLKANANVELLDKKGKLVRRSKRSGTKDESINLTVDAGTYYVRVYQGSGDTTYRLSMTGNKETAGDSRSDATEITLTDSNPSFKDFVGQSDKKDTFTFDLSEISKVSVSVNGLKSKVLLALRDSDGKLIAKSVSSGTTAEPIEQNLKSGQYFVEVSRKGKTSSTTYNLIGSAGPIPDTAGNTSNNAKNLGRLDLQGTKTETEFLGTNDTDWYKFKTASGADSKLTLKLSCLTADADVELFTEDNPGTPIGFSFNSGTDDEVISANLTQNTTYLIKVSKSNNAATTFFDLELKTEVDIDDFAGQFPDETARDIDAEPDWADNNGIRGPVNLGDFVGSGIDDADYYKFTITESSFVSLTVTPDQNNTKATADVELLGSDGTTLLDNAARAGNAIETIEGVLDAGKYFIKVRPSQNGTFAFYDFQLKATSTELTPAFVKDILEGTGSSSSFSSPIVEIGGTAYFVANGGNGVALWKSDGTLDGTSLVKTFDGGINDLIAVGDTIYLVANDSSAGNTGFELWKSDGTAGGTSLVKDIFVGSTSSAITNLTAVGNKLYFTAVDIEVPNSGNVNQEVWVSDGTSAGTKKFDITGDDFGSDPGQLTAVGNTLYFVATNPSTFVPNLYKIDNGANSATLVDSTLSNVSNLTAFNNTLYFSASNGTRGNELWRITSGAIAAVGDIVPGASGSSSIGQLTVVGTTLFFTAGGSTSDVELWKLNGNNDTDNDTVSIVKNINPLSTSSPSNLTAVGNTLYFSANDGTNGTELWKSDGTPGGTQLVSNISPLDGSSNPSSLINVGGTLYFTADDGVNGTELWRLFSGVGQTPTLLDILPGAESSQPSTLTAINGRLFFRATNGETGQELWVVGLPTPYTENRFP
jgi:ELWxxDGT repeat protein